MKKLMKISALMTAIIILFGTQSIMAEEWVRVPLATEEQRDRGMMGGEGCQWPQAIAISRSNPDFMMFGTDVSSVYKSTNGGKTWVHSNSGYNSRGASSGLVIDPFNEKHIISVGSNSASNSANGLYTSFDGAETWKQTCAADICGYRDFRDQVAFDPTSYDEKTKMCTVAYWSRVEIDPNSPAPQPGLYRTDDGGNTWKMLADSARYGGMFVAVNEKNGDVYLSGHTGFYKSPKGGESFEKNFDGIFTSMCTIYTKPDEVYLSTWNTLYKSEDGGESFNVITMTSPPSNQTEEKDWSDPQITNSYDYGWHEFKVSPANPDYMMIVVGTGAYTYYRWYSHDGGKTWKKTAVDNTLSMMPFNQRQSKIAYHPTDPNIIFSFGGDWVTKSEDGGKTFFWSNDGNNSVAYRGKPNINVYDSNLWFAPLTDYNSAGSEDGGVTWHYGQLTDAVWGGQGLGGYMVSKDYILGVENTNGHLCLYESDGLRNGIYNFKKKTVDSPDTNNELWLDSKYVYQSPTDANILFAGQYISRDIGKTWSKMDGCIGVYMHNYDPNGKKELFGYASTDNKAIVCSEDNGQTWKTLIKTDEPILDFSYDFNKNAFYVVAGAMSGGQNLYRYTIDKSTNTTDKETLTDKIKLNCFGGRRIKSVSVDPNNTNIIYVAGSGDLYVNDASVQRSTDGGETWEIIVRNNRDTVINSGESGGAEGSDVWVDPKTSYAYVNTSCYGLWKIGPPGTVEDHLEPMTAISEDGKVNVRWFGNGRMSVSEMSRVAYNSKYNQEQTNAIISAYDKNGDRVIDENDIGIINKWIFSEWDKSLDKFELYRSTDGEKFERILGPVTDTKYVDENAETGKDYWYKVKNLTNGSYTKTVKVKVK